MVGHPSGFLPRDRPCELLLRRAELRELLYVAEEPGFFELMRGLFALSDESRAVLQQFLDTGRPMAMEASIDPKGRLTIEQVGVEQRVKMLPMIAK